MKSSFFGVSYLLSGALTLGALALAGCGGGGSGSQSPTPNPNSVLLNTIVFSSNRAGAFDIYSMRADGSVPTRLTTSSAADTSPSRSRDGQRIVFSSVRAGNPEIYSMGIAGEATGLLRLTADAGASAPDDTQPKFSPDGSTIAWISTRGGASNIWLMDSTGANQRQLTTEGKISEVDFSPDGSEVAFSVRRSVNAIIVAKNIASGSERVLVQGNFGALAPAYSPNGGQLLFTASTSNSLKLQLLNFATGAISDAPGQNGATPNVGFNGLGDFSPSGTQIVGEVGPIQQSGASGPPAQIGIASLTGGSVITLLTGQTGSGFTNVQPSWGQ